MGHELAVNRSTRRLHSNSMALDGHKTTREQQIMRRKKDSGKGGAQKRKRGAEELTRAWRQKLWHGEAVPARP